MPARPRVVLLADRPGWAFSQIASSLIARLSGRYDFRLIHREVEPVELRDEDVDLLYVFFWGDESYQHLGIDPAKIVVEVASHRWATEEKFGPLDAVEFAERWLSACRLVTTPSRRLHHELQAVHPAVVLCPNGVETGVFRPPRERRGGLRIAWVGNPRDACKGLHELLLPACRGRFALQVSDGRRSRQEIVRLYQQSDVIAIASVAESQPLPLLEGMACGCFPVATDVGIVPELVRSGVNGLVVERSVEAFREAFAWCETHLAQVRRAGAFDSELVRAERSWDRLAGRFADVFDAVLGQDRAFAAVEPRSAPRLALERGAIPTRIALLTPEFVTEYATGGGLGNYLARLALSLRDLGHRPEIFVTSGEPDTDLEWNGIPVHRVRSVEKRRALHFGLRLASRLRMPRLAWTAQLLGNAWALASALRRREAEAPFDLVQSADYLASGLFVSRTRSRPHLVRCSWDGPLWAETGSGNPQRRRWEGFFERISLRRATGRYAPSRFLAKYLGERYGLAVDVVRPPALLDLGAETRGPQPLPERYLVHFGQLGHRKGTSQLVEALKRAWEWEPELHMLWAGPDRGNRMPAWRDQLGERSGQVVWLGELPKSQLYPVVSGAEAAVLPSQVDNLPNTVIESLLLGVPVIGSAGASIDELVEPGINGELIPVGDVDALADALVRFWRGEVAVRKGFRWASAIAEAMRPERAVGELFRVAGL